MINRFFLEAIRLIAMTALCGSTVCNARHTSVQLKGATHAASCEESLRIIRAMGKELQEPNTATFFVNDPPNLGARDRYIAEGSWMGQSPAGDLVAAWKHVRRRSILSCIPGKTFEARPVITLAEEERIRSHSSPTSSNWFVRASVPVLDSSGRYALLLYESNGAHFGGHAEAYLLERRESGWKVVGRNILSMS